MKRFSLGVLTFICIIFLVIDITLFALKLGISKYIDTAKLINIISDVDVADLLVDYDIVEIDSIKSDLEKSGVPSDKVNKFLTSKPVNSYASDVAEKTINNTLSENKDKVVKKNEIYNFLDDNISSISKETKIFKTKEEQDKFLEKIKDKSPSIENNINRVVSRVQKRLNEEGYINKLGLFLRVFDIFYKKIINIFLLFMFIIFSLGIIISRGSFYKSLKWVGLSFLLAAVMCIGFSFIEVESYLKFVPKIFMNNIKDIIIDLSSNMRQYGIIYAVIGAALVNMNIIYYLGLDKKVK